MSLDLIKIASQVGSMVARLKAGGEERQQRLQHALDTLRKQAAARMEAYRAFRDAGAKPTTPALQAVAAILRGAGFTDEEIDAFIARL